MAINKKRIIDDYCKSCSALCTNCKIKHICKPIYGDFKSNPTERDKAYDIVIGLQNKNVNSPSYYNDGKIEVIDYIEDKNLGFCLGNAIKYISRAGKKNPDKEIEDLNKAIWYLNRRIKELEEDSNEIK